MALNGVEEITLASMWGHIQNLLRERQDVRDQLHSIQQENTKLKERVAELELKVEKASSFHLSTFISNIH